MKIKSMWLLIGCLVLIPSLQAQTGKFEKTHKMMKTVVEDMRQNCHTNACAASANALESFMANAKIAKERGDYKTPETKKQFRKAFRTVLLNAQRSLEDDKESSKLTTEAKFKEVKFSFGGGQYNAGQCRQCDSVYKVAVALCAINAVGTGAGGGAICLLISTRAWVDCQDQYCNPSLGACDFGADPFGCDDDD